MKYTDTFFKFPIRMYDGYELKKAVEIEELSNQPMPSTFVIAAKRVKHTDIIGWYDIYDKETSIEEILDTNNFPCTLVQLEKDGDYLCNWSRQKFESELDKFVEKMKSCKL